MVFKKKRVWHCLPGQEPTELDKRVMYWENKGKEVPSRDLIKTPEQIEGIRRSGVVNTGVLDEVAKHIHAGMNTLEIDQICYDYCTAHGAVPACLNYEGFPKSVCTSINEVVCHGIPKEEDVLQEGDIVNVDFTTILDGYYAVAHHLVDTCADTLREALVVETSRHSAMCCTVVVAYLVDLESVHASMNMLSHLVEHTGVHHTAAAYAFYLFRSLDKVARRHLLTLILPIHYSFVKFCRLLSRQTVPNSFLLEYHNNYIKAPTTWEVFLF
jgi:hypothetical protein